MWAAWSMAPGWVLGPLLEEARADARVLVLGLDLEGAVEGLTESSTHAAHAEVAGGALVLRDANGELAVVLRHLTNDLVVAGLVHHDLGEHEQVRFWDVEDEEVSILSGLEDDRVLC